MISRTGSVFSLVFTACLALLLTGCTLPATSPDAPIASADLQGKIYGGNQPVVGAHVYLMAAAVSGVGSAGYGVASTSLLNSALTGNSDSIGGYVLTNSAGVFSLDSVAGSTTYFYTCPSATTQVYLYALGGNPGAGGANSAAGFMLALGSCGNLSSSTSVFVNELTTVAAAYSFAGFATDALHVSIPQYATTTQQTNSITDALALTGLENAFANAVNLANNTTGAAVTATANGIPNFAQVITLGNMLAACINSASSSSANCVKLLGNAGSTGGATGTTPTDTATAAINIAHYPWVSSSVMTNLYSLQAASGAPFANGDTSQPNDFTISINFTGGGLDAPYGIAIDGSGNAWVANNGNDISKFSSSGTAISTSAGYTGGGLSSPNSITIDASGNAWVANSGASDISKFSSSGTAISTSAGYTGGGLKFPYFIAIDASGNAWVANNGSNDMSKFSSSGTAISTSAGYTGGGLDVPYGIAIDASANVWVVDCGSCGAGSDDISKFSSSGTAISTSAGYTGGGLNGPQGGIAIDGSGNVWVPDFGGGDISKFSSSGTAISSSSGYTGGGLIEPASIAIDGSGNAWVANAGGSAISKFSSSGTPISPSSGYTGNFIGPNSIAVDGSGNVWVANENGSPSKITEFVGAGSPVVTPMVANLIAPYTAPASKP